MKIDYCLLTFFAEEEGAVGWVVHEEVFGEDGGAGGMAEEVEVFLEVRVAVGVVGAEALAVEGCLGGLVEAGGEGREMSLSSGTRSSASRPRERRRSTMRELSLMSK